MTVWGDINIEYVVIYAVLQYYHTVVLILILNYCVTVGMKK